MRFGSRNSLAPRAALGNLTPEQREIIDLMTRSIVNKIAHGPISELRKQAGDPEGVHVIDAIRRVFRLREHAPK